MIFKQVAGLLSRKEIHNGHRVTSGCVTAGSVMRSSRLSQKWGMEGGEGVPTSTSEVNNAMAQNPYTWSTTPMFYIHIRGDLGSGLGALNPKP